jgi:hypothetical protein
MNRALFEVGEEVIVVPSGRMKPFDAVVIAVEIHQKYMDRIGYLVYPEPLSPHNGWSERCLRKKHKGAGDFTAMLDGLKRPMGVES